MPADLQLVAVPYDTALRGVRMGAGPTRLLEGGLAEALRSAGHVVGVEHVEAPGGTPPAEIRTAFELNRALAGRVAQARSRGAVPVVLAGNCITAVGTLAGLGGDGAAVAWFDAHGDFNTPETTAGGFLDGMALAVATGRCWRTLASTVPGFAPLAEARVVMVGTRDLDPPERELLAASAVTVLPPERVGDLESVLDRMGATEAYVHLDLDALDPSVGRANGFAAPGGLTLEAAAEALRMVARRLPVAAVALTAYDPSCDPDGRIPPTAAALLAALLSSPDGA